MNTLETSIIGAIVHAPELLDTAAAHSVTGETFTDRTAREIFTTLQTLAAEGMPDLVLLDQRRPDLTLAAAEAYKSVPTTANFCTWIAEAKDREARRQIVAACKKALNDAENGETKTKTLCEALEGAIETARATTKGRHCPSLAEAARDIVADLQAGPRRTIPLFPSNTEAARKVKIHPGEFWIIGAGTGVGKTEIAATMLSEMLSEGLNVAYFCTESTTEAILRRIAAPWAGVSHMAEGERARLKLADGVAMLAKQYARKLHIIGDNGGPIMPGIIRRTLRQIEAEDGPADVVVVDFIQNMKPDKPARSALEEINTIIQSVHDTLKESRAAGLVLAQFNRQSQSNAETGKGHNRPNLTWLKDSSTLEQLADGVAFLHKTRNEEREFYSEKTRNCFPFHLVLKWDGVKYLSADAATGEYETNA